jgi:hypothetical protein
MATRRYAKSNKATMPTMMFSIPRPSHLLAKADIDSADHEKQDDNSDVNQISHKLVFNFGSATT